MTKTADLELDELETAHHDLKLQALIAAVPLVVAVLGWLGVRKQLKAARHELALAELAAAVDPPPPWPVPRPVDERPGAGRYVTANLEEVEVIREGG